MPVLPLSLIYGLFAGFTFTTTQWTALAQRELLFNLGIRVLCLVWGLSFELLAGKAGLMYCVGCCISCLACCIALPVLNVVCWLYWFECGIYG